VVFGANTSTLTITNLTYADPTNFVVVLTGTYGSLTSSVVSLTVAATQVPLAFWNFNGSFNTANPAPYQGLGTASLANCTGFAQTSADGLDSSGGGVNYGWGTDIYPASGLNTNAGVQFNVSTVGAKNITVSFDTRATSTASKYQQLQYTINGTDWINYPASSAFTFASAWQSRSYSLVGFPGVANNPNFGIRIVTEYESTASYGAINNPQYVGVSSTYSPNGTVSFDVVTISGDAITNAYAPPVVSTISNTATVDDTPVTVSFTVSGGGPFLLSATSLNQAVLTDSAFTFGVSGANSNLTVNPQVIDGIVPVLVMAANPSGDLATTWFYLTLNPANQPPTISSLPATNILANSSITIPFTVGDDRTPLSGLTFGTNSGNTTLVPSANVVVNGQGTANPTVTITPAANKVGVAPISVTVYDNDATSTPKSTTTSFTVMVLPNTNVVFVDNFDYDTAGPIISQSAGLWQTHSGTAGQLAVGGGVLTVDQSLTEDCNAKLIGQPYMTNSGAVLYSSFVVNFSVLPTMAGAYFENYLDLATIGSGAGTAYGARVWASISNAAPSMFRLGICNGSGGTNTSGQVAMDLGLNTNYTVVTRFVLTNGVATIWINPSSESSPGVTATDLATSPSFVDNPINVTSVAFRQNTEEGVLTVDNLKVGFTFDSVLPALHIQPAGTSVILNWSDPTLGIQSTTNLLSPFTDVSGATPPYTNNASTNNMMFFRFKR
jgi:hypothetical protein